MAQRRLNRDQFFDKLDGMDEAALKKALWTLNWRGAAAGAYREHHRPAGGSIA